MQDIETMLADLNRCLATLSEIERMPKPLDQFTQMRVSVCEYIAAKCLAELQALKDAEGEALALIERVKS